jgi:hypothetical protein
MPLGRAATAIADTPVVNKSRRFQAHVATSDKRPALHPCIKIVAKEVELPITGN